MIPVLWVASAFAQDYAFPTSVDDYAAFYPTAYRDHGGVTDWDCQSLTYAGHQGSDFGGGGFPGMDAGRDITAGADGVVIATHDGEFDRCTTGACYGGGGFGNYVYVEHADGKVTIYGHLKQFSVLVAVGDAVVCGQKLGEMGSSGYSTGPHLHFQVNNASGAAEDPFDGPCSAPPTYWLSQGVHAGLPSNTCGPPPPCVPVGALGCGEVVSASNDGAGSTSSTYQYGCSDFVYSGPELSWTFTSAVQTPVTLSMTGLADDLDLYVVGSTACAGDDCVGASTNPSGDDEVVDFEAEAGVEYVIVVDGWEGAVSAFDLDVACAVVPGDTGATGSTPDDSGTSGTTPPTPGDDDDDDETDDTDDTDDDVDGVPGAPLTSSQPQVLSAPEGCGCAGPGGARGGLGVLVVLSLLAASRRRRV
jgi:murein DD-endopeptidase MepM/ murein hydrolase activator NlpD